MKEKLEDTDYDLIFETPYDCILYERDLGKCELWVKHHSVASYAILYKEWQLEFVRTLYCTQCECSLDQYEALKLTGYTCKNCYDKTMKEFDEDLNKTRNS